MQALNFYECKTTRMSNLFTLGGSYTQWKLIQKWFGDSFMAQCRETCLSSIAQAQTLSEREL